MALPNESDTKADRVYLVVFRGCAIQNVRHVETNKLRAQLREQLVII